MSRSGAYSMKMRATRMASRQSRIATWLFGFQGVSGSVSSWRSELTTKVVTCSWERERFLALLSVFGRSAAVKCLCCTISSSGIAL